MDIEGVGASGSAVCHRTDPVGTIHRIGGEEKAKAKSHTAASTEIFVLKPSTARSSSNLAFWLQAISMAGGKPAVASLSMPDSRSGDHLLITVVIVLVLGIQVLVERSMLPLKPAVLAAMCASRVRLTVEGLMLGVEILVALLVFLAQLFMDLTMFPRVMRKSQGSSEQQPREGKDGKSNFLQVSIHEMTSLCVC